MSKTPEDDWPPYIKGKRLHLQAVGVIAHAFNSFENSILRLYLEQAQRVKIPDSLAALYYLELNEQKRLSAIRFIFQETAQTDEINVRVNAIVDYFAWSWNVRNNIIHSELYPAIFNISPDKLHLSKRIAKKSLDRGYLQLNVATLRDYADRIEAGTVACAGLTIWLRYRHLPAEKWPPLAKAAGPTTLPEIISVPPPLELSEHPLGGLTL